jgi:hypothetical protein
VIHRWTVVFHYFSLVFESNNIFWGLAQSKPTWHRWVFENRRRVEMKEKGKLGRNYLQLAYLISSCLEPSNSESWMSQLLPSYLEVLSRKQPLRCQHMGRRDFAQGSETLPPLLPAVESFVLAHQPVQCALSSARREYLPRQNSLTARKRRKISSP